MAAATQQAQKDAVGATGAYLSAFLTSEVGHRTRGPILDTRRYSGLSRDGRPLTEALRSPMIGVRLKLKEGATPQEALAYGLNRAKRMVSVDYDHAHRTALLDGLAADERFAGWQRAVTGTCGACAGDIAVEVSTNLPSTPLQVHPNCQCVTEPVVRPKSLVQKVLPPAYEGPVDEALSAVDDLHAYPAGTGRTMIATGPTGGANGTMLPAGSGAQIRLATGSAPDASTVIHELGHRVDLALGQEAKAFLSTTADEGAAKVLGAIRKSGAFERLEKSAVLSDDVKAYYTGPKELFARAYAQWVGDTKGLKIGGHADINHGIQWDRDDFGPIKDALEALFRDRGLLK
jgi:hypothetical protein